MSNKNDSGKKVHQLLQELKEKFDNYQKTYVTALNVSEEVSGKISSKRSELQEEIVPERPKV